MNPNWAEVVQAIGEAGSLMVGIVGFGVVIYQIRQLKKAIHGETHGKLYPENYETIKLFLEYPQLRPYFYDNTDITRSSPDYNLAITVAELFCSLFEHVVLQMENLPEYMRPEWENYIRSMYSSSPIIREHLNQNKTWYTKLLHDIVSRP